MDKPKIADSMFFRKQYSVIFNGMKRTRYILAISYILVSCVTVLVMLVTSFEQFQEKYLPSFLAAQKFALPVVLSAMAAGYLFFFEPERLAQKRTLVVMRIAMIITLGLFSYYFTTIDMKAISEITLVLFVVQWITTVVMTGFFFKKHP